MDMSKMLKDLQKMQSKMLKAQSDLKAQSFDAEAGGGMVKVAINGQGEILYHPDLETWLNGHHKISELGIKPAVSAAPPGWPAKP